MVLPRCVFFMIFFLSANYFSTRNNAPIFNFRGIYSNRTFCLVVTLTRSFFDINCNLENSKNNIGEMKIFPNNSFEKNLKFLKKIKKEKS